MPEQLVLKEGELVVVSDEAGDMPEGVVISVSITTTLATSVF
jgi:hypothetical protein